jgi:hypothetical protein
MYESEGGPPGKCTTGHRSDFDLILTANESTKVLQTASVNRFFTDPVANRPASTFRCRVWQWLVRNCVDAGWSSGITRREAEKLISKPSRQ